MNLGFMSVLNVNLYVILEYEKKDKKKRPIYNIQYCKFLDLLFSLDTTR